MKIDKLRKSLSLKTDAHKSRCSRGVSESMYDPVSLLSAFLEKQGIAHSELSDKEIMRLYGFSEFAADMFY